MTVMAWAGDNRAAAVIGVIALALTACAPPPERRVLEVAIPPTTTALIPEPQMPAPGPPKVTPPAADHGLGLSPEGNRAVEDLLHSKVFGFSAGVTGERTPEFHAMKTLEREQNAKAAALYVIKKGTPSGQLVALMVLRTADPVAFKVQSRPFRNRTDKVKTVSGCIIGESPVRDLVPRVEGRDRLVSTSPTNQDLHAAMKEQQKKRERERGRR